MNRMWLAWVVNVSNQEEMGSHAWDCPSSETIMFLRQEVPV